MMRAWDQIFLTLVGSFVILSLCFISLSLAHDRHGMANWITKDYPNCCGPEDCEIIDERRVSRVGQTWRVRGLGGSVRKVNLSQDGKTWTCRNLSNNSLRCLFLPGLN